MGKKAKSPKTASRPAKSYPKLTRRDAKSFSELSKLTPRPAKSCPKVWSEYRRESLLDKLKERPKKGAKPSTERKICKQRKVALSTMQYERAFGSQNRQSKSDKDDYIITVWKELNNGHRPRRFNAVVGAAELRAALLERTADDDEFKVPAEKTVRAFMAKHRGGFKQKFRSMKRQEGGNTAANEDNIAAVIYSSQNLNCYQ